MDRFNALGRGMQLMLVGAVLLFISLFLPWQDFDTSGVAESLGLDASWSAWHGFGGYVLGLLTLVLIAWIVARLAAVDIPIPVSAAMTAAVLAFLILAFAVLKNLIDDYSAWGSYVGVVLAVVVAVGAWLQIQESGGIETLKSEIPSMPASSTTSASAPEPPAATAPPPAAPGTGSAGESEAAPDETTERDTT